MNSEPNSVNIFLPFTHMDHSINFSRTISTNRLVPRGSEDSRDGPLQSN